MRMTPERWRESVDAGNQMLIEAGVIVTQLNQNLGGVTVLFDGKPWNP